MEWEKLIEVVIGLTDGFVQANAVVVLTFASVKWQDGKWKIEGKSGENLWNAVLLSGILILLDCVCLS